MKRREKRERVMVENLHKRKVSCSYTMSKNSNKYVCKKTQKQICFPKGA